MENSSYFCPLAPQAAGGRGPIRGNRQIQSSLSSDLFKNLSVLFLFNLSYFLSFFPSLWVSLTEVCL